MYSVILIQAEEKYVVILVVSLVISPNLDTDAWSPIKKSGNGDFFTSLFFVLQNLLYQPKITLREVSLILSD